MRIISIALVVAFLFSPLLYTSIAATIDKHRASISAPEWASFARIGTVAVTILCLASIFFFQRRVSTKSAEMLRKKSKDPALMIFICGLALLLTPTCISFFLFLIGNPVIDVYAYSVFSFIATVGWSWHQRGLFRVVAEVEHDMPSREAVPRATVPQQTLSIATVRAYTIILLLLGALAFAFSSLKVLLVMNPPEHYTKPVLGDMPFALIYALLAIGCWVGALMRICRSAYAIPVTSVVSMMLVIWFPLGTAACVYWFGWVRKKEHQGKNNSTRRTPAPQIDKL